MHGTCKLTALFGGDPILPPNNIPHLHDIADWSSTCLVALSASSPYPDTTLSSSRVHLIRFLKQRLTYDFREHEYVVLYITQHGQPWHHPSAALGAIRFDRSPDPADDSSLGHFLVILAALLSYIPLLRSLLTLQVECMTMRALDTALIYDAPLRVGEIEGADEVLYERSFTQVEAPSLFSAIAAAVVVHEAAPGYDITREQCFWHALVLFRLLGGEFADGGGGGGGPELHTSAFALAFLFRRCRHRAGSFKWVQIITEREVEAQVTILRLRLARRINILNDVVTKLHLSHPWQIYDIDPREAIREQMSITEEFMSACEVETLDEDRNVDMDMDRQRCQMIDSRHGDWVRYTLMMCALLVVLPSICRAP